MRLVSEEMTNDLNYNFFAVGKTLQGLLPAKQNPPKKKKNRISDFLVGKYFSRNQTAKQNANTDRSR